jgi:hypothetical protein
LLIHVPFVKRITFFEKGVVMKTFTGAVTPLIIAGQLFLFSTSVNAQPGPVARYPLGDIGITVFDSSGNGNNGTASGVTRTADRFGINNTADSFNGTSSRITVNDAPSLRPSTITVSAWVKRATLGGDRKIVGKNLNSNISDSYNLGIYDDNKIEFWVYSSGWHGVRGISGGTTVAIGAWYHVVGVYDGNTVTTYLNGQFDRTSVVGSVVIDYSIDPLYIGQTPTGDYFHGDIDDVRIYNRALSGSEITALYQMNGWHIPVLIPYTPNPTYVRRPQLRWYHHDSISVYRIQIDTNKLFASPMVSQTVTTDTFYTPTVDLPYDTIYWRVRNDADTLSWSTISSVRIVHPFPTLIAYTPNPTSNRRPQLRWYTNSYISTYRIQIDTTQLFTSPIVSQSLPDTFFTPGLDLPYATVYWRVRNDADPLSWSTVSSVSIMRQYSPNVVAHWSFDSSAGSTYYDVTGHGYDASGTGAGFGLVPGIIGQALNCSASAYQMTVANSAGDFYLSRFSVECWFYSNVNPSLNSSEGKILDYSYIQSGTMNGWSVDLTPLGSIRLIMTNAGGSSWEIASTPSSVIQGMTWYHIACTYDSATLRIYVNGTLSGSLAYQGRYLAPNGSAHIGYQKRSDGSSMYYVNGRIDELKLFNYALPIDSVTAHYNAIPRPVLIAYTPNPTYNWRPLLQWHTDPAISLFRIQIATDTAFSSPTVSLTTTDTFYLPTADVPLGTIYWRAGNEVITGFDFWSIRSSVIVQDSTVPVLIPYTPDPTSVRRPQFMWHPGRGATGYTIQISNAPTFTTPIIIDLTSDTVYSPAVDLPLGAIYWHVKSNGGKQYSAPDTFRILSDSVPMLIPMTPDTQTTRRPRFRWYPALSATSYLLQIDLAGNFATPYFSTTLPDTTYPMTSNLPLGKIFWRVGAIYTATTKYSSTDTFWISGTGIVPKTADKNNRPMSASFALLRRGITVDYSLERQGMVSLDIFSIAGNRIATVYKGTVSEGNHTLLWDGADKTGKSLSAGSYIAVLKIDRQLFTKKIALTR